MSRAVQTFRTHEHVALGWSCNVLQEAGSHFWRQTEEDFVQILDGPGQSSTLGRGTLQFLLLLGELVLTAGLRRSMSSAVSCCWIGSAKDTRLD